MLTKRITRLKTINCVKLKGKPVSKKDQLTVSVTELSTKSPYFEHSSGDEIQTDSLSHRNKKIKTTPKKHIDPVYEDDRSIIPEYLEITSPTSKKIYKFDKSFIKVKVEKPKWFPENWNEQLNNIYEMRKTADAPVDTMGCDKLGDEAAKPEDYRYQILLSLMLSSQTKDHITAAALDKLKKHGCSVDNILKTSDKKLGELIYPAGFWKRKVEFIKKTSEILRDQYNGDIPDSINGLCKLPGVGPKMAHLVMKSAWNIICGIAVDTHVHRISNRLRWVANPTSQPEHTRKAVEDWLPLPYWCDINALLVGFGQQTCLPVGPKCTTCLNREICVEGCKNTRGKPPKAK